MRRGRQRLLRDAEQAEAALKSLADLKVANPGNVEDDDFRKLRELINQSNRIAKNHLEACVACNKETDVTAS